MTLQNVLQNEECIVIATGTCTAHVETNTNADLQLGFTSLIIFFKIGISNIVLFLFARKFSKSSFSDVTRFRSAELPMVRSQKD